MSVMKFTNADEVLKRANKSKYGLAAGIYSNDINTVLKLANGLQAGTVWVNCYGHVTPQAPFGGFKQSGFGREMYVHHLISISKYSLQINHNN